MREALADPNLLGAAIAGDSWQPWRVLLIAMMGEALEPEERALFRLLTNRDCEPGEPVDEFWGVVGRRGGKTRAAAVLAVYIAALCDHSAVLASGERGVVPILAASTTQASRAFNHAKGILGQSPVLSGLVEGDTTDTIKLSTRIDIETRAASFRTIRGITAVAAVADEVAFWHLEGAANPDVEILNALRPALATTGGPLMVISSPHARRGELYTTFKLNFGEHGDPRILVATGPSKRFNSTLPQRVIDRAYARDEAAAKAEFGGEFRSDVEVFVTREVVEACVAAKVFERAPVEGITYRAFVDPSGGSIDAMTLAIGHTEGETAVLDLVRERKPPFSPEAVVEEFAATLKSYGITSVTGDRYGGEFVRETFRRHGVEYRLADKTRSDLYQALLPTLNSGSVSLLDNVRLVDQIVGLERRVARGGRESIDHAPRAHDDLANAVAGVVALCVARPIQAPHPIFGTYSARAAPNALVGRYGRPRPPAALSEFWSGHDYRAANQR